MRFRFFRSGGLYLVSILPNDLKLAAFFKLTPISQPPTLSRFLEINLAMIFIGTSGILGRFVPLDAIPAVWWRAAIGFLFIAAFCRWKGYSFRIEDPKRRWLVILSGILMMGHWVLYFYALKLSSVAIGMLSIFTYPAMTTLLEPLLLKQEFQTRHLLLVVLGLISALVYSLRNILMKTQVNSIQGSVMMTYQTAITVLCLLPALFFFLRHDRLLLQ